MTTERRMELGETSVRIINETPVSDWGYMGALRTRLGVYDVCDGEHFTIHTEVWSSGGTHPWLGQQVRMDLDMEQMEALISRLQYFYKHQQEKRRERESWEARAKAQMARHEETEAT